MPPPETTSVTKPAAAHYDPEVSASQQMSNEEVRVYVFGSGGWCVQVVPCPAHRGRLTEARVWGG